ncbi:Hpr(Ser) kinase/phosphatase [Palleronia aestuarii]|uniref:Hpr(Ser) kinase/phosphatase n=1 Tax=Palleronia aestuarii TaxID=568105 RepID=A0A2W7N898_9RHOB|nr:serine kinase [Palleronia aestuarii]PZX16645.1 Hpr(Ser) kinase/phosphatase [Palleronia aestuarii]
MTRPPEPGTILHASAVAWEGRGILLRGRAGGGKSSLAFQLMALGAQLVADDQTALAASPRGLLAWAPATILGLVEARGVGLLRADPAPPTPIALVVDLDHAAERRLPDRATCDILGIRLPLISGRDNPHIPAIIVQILKGGLAEDR